MANRLIAVSLKSRGLSVFDKPPFGPGWLAELRQSVVAQTIDLAIAIATNVVLLNWSTWFSVILTILSICFYGFFQGGRVARADGSILIPITFLIYLPALWLAHTASSRRLEAARHLETVQSHVVGMYGLHAGLSSCGAPQQLAELDDAINDAMVQLQGYLAHHRPLSTTHFCPATLRAENLPVNSSLFALGRDIGQRLRRLHSCQRRMSAAVSALLEHCGSSRAGQHFTQQALALLQLLVPLSSAIGRLICLKEARSPLLLRAMLRGSCVVLAPLMTGSWLAGLAGQPAGAVGMVFAIVIGSILQVLLMSVLTLALLLEDPFDTGPTAAPDTISLLEFNHTLSYLTAPPNTDDSPPADDDAAAEQQQVQQKYHQQIQGFVLQQQAGLRQSTEHDAAPVAHSGSHTAEPVAHTAVTMTISASGGAGGASGCADEAAVGGHAYEYEYDAPSATAAAVSTDGTTKGYVASQPGATATPMPAAGAGAVAASRAAPSDRAARGNGNETRQRASPLMSSQME